MSSQQTDQWRLPVRSSDPAHSGSLAVHPPCRLRSMTAKGDWRLAGMSAGKIACGHEKMSYKKDNNACVAHLAVVLYIPKQDSFAFNSPVRLQNEKGCFTTPPIWFTSSASNPNVANSCFGQTAVRSVNWRNICHMVLYINKKSPFTPEVKALAPLCREQGSISQHNASIRPFHLTEHKS